MKVFQEDVDAVVRLDAAGELSRRQIAKVIGLSRSTVHNILSGKFKPLRQQRRIDETRERGIPYPPMHRVGCECFLCYVRNDKALERSRLRA